MTYYIFDKDAASAAQYLDTYLSWFKSLDIDCNRPCKFVGQHGSSVLSCFDFTTRQGVVKVDQHVHTAFFRPYLPEPFNESDWL